MTTRAAAPEQVDEGHSLLSRISNEMVRAQKEFFGKGPTQAKSYILDDLLIIVMRDGLTTAEKTMVEFGHQDQVRQFRQLFENAMTERLTGMIERLTGRTVLTYQSQIMFAPDVVVEMFVFDRPADDRAREATAEGQIHDDAIGEATDRDVLDRPAASGQSTNGPVTSAERSGTVANSESAGSITGPGFA